MVDDGYTEEGLDLLVNKPTTSAHAGCLKRAVVQLRTQLAAVKRELAEAISVRDENWQKHRDLEHEFYQLERNFTDYQGRFNRVQLQLAAAQRELEVRDEALVILSNIEPEKRIHPILVEARQRVEARERELQGAQAIAGNLRTVMKQIDQTDVNLYDCKTLARDAFLASNLVTPAIERAAKDRETVRLALDAWRADQAYKKADDAIDNMSEIMSWINNANTKLMDNLAAREKEEKGK